MERKKHFFYLDKRYGNDFYNFCYCSPEDLPPFCLSYSEPGRGGPAIANVIIIVLILNIVIIVLIINIVIIVLILNIVIIVLNLNVNIIVLILNIIIPLILTSIVIINFELLQQRWANSVYGTEYEYEYYSKKY